MPTIATPPRAEPQVYQERVEFLKDFPATSASANIKLVTTDKDIDLEQVEICDPTGLAANVSNFYVVSIKAGATVVASWSTSTAGQGALPANTHVNMVIPAATKRIPAGSVLSLDFVLTGTATLPLGLVHFRGHAR